MPEKRIGIIGATGYTGSELVRILSHHPKAEIAVITSESRAGEKFSDVHPSFLGVADHELVVAEQVNEQELDLVFLALPHGVSMEFVKRYENRSFKIIDLSGDFRLTSAVTYEEWYQKEHHYTKGLEEAVFGLPELFAGSIRPARLVANPGCYPTSAILGIAPLLSAGLIEVQSLIVDAKSGVTGAGVHAKPVNHFCQVNDNFRAYGLKNHRHTIEIQETLDRLSGKTTTVQFTPHLLPVDRGILSTIYARPLAGIDEKTLQNTYREFYANAPFVRIRKQAPTIKDVRGSNFCDLYPLYDQRTGRIIVLSAIDNLVKGAAGQAVQNMNLLFGWEETLGLQHLPLKP